MPFSKRATGGGQAQVDGLFLSTILLGFEMAVGMLAVEARPDVEKLSAGAPRLLSFSITRLEKDHPWVLHIKMQPRSREALAGQMLLVASHNVVSWLDLVARPY